jgi:hypothetical protein
MKTFFQLREETAGKTLKVSRDIFEAAQQMMSEESAKPLDHKGLEKVANLGHGAHEVEHPGDTRGGAELSHPYAYAHKGKAVQIKDKKTTAAHVAKAMGHSTVTKAHHAIADYHNDSV